jgi:hypothetical protein
MSLAEARGLKIVTRRVVPFGDPARAVLLGTESGVATFGDSIPDDPVPIEVKSRWRPGNVVYFGEALAKSDDMVPLVQYRRDGQYCCDVDSGDPMEWTWKVSTLAARYCPARCARRYGRIFSATVERLHDITNTEAFKEGAKPHQSANDPFLYGFRLLWDEINGARGLGWDLNPWVWRVQWVSILQQDAIRAEAKRTRRRVRVDGVAEEVPQHQRS